MNILSVSEFLETEGSLSLILLFLIAFSLPATISGLINFRNEARYGKYERGDISIENNAKILYYRTDTYGVNYITFELQSSEKKELAIEDMNTYGELVKGGYGTLTYQGSRFINFTKNQ